MKTIILCDFDGTIIASDAYEELLVRYAGPEGRQLMNAFQSEKIDAPELIETGFSLMKASLTELNHCLDKMTIDPTFPPFVEFCQREGYELYIASDGLDWYIQRILDNHGLGSLPIIANLVTFEGPTPRLSFPWRNENCTGCHGRYGVCKRDVVLSFKSSDAQVILIGDGLSDSCGVLVADLIFAKRHLREYCLAAGYPFKTFYHFNDITVALLSDKEL